MGATVVNDSAVNAYSLKRAMDKGARAQNLKGYSASGVYVISKAFSIPTTSIDDVGDEYHLLTFPPNCQLLSLYGKVTDMDSNATPTLTFDILSDDNVSTENKLVNASTAAQAGGNFALGASGATGIGAVDPAFLSVGGTDLVFQTAAASATAVAGTLTIRAVVMVGPSKLVTTW